MSAFEFSEINVFQSTQNAGTKFIFKFGCTNFCRDFRSVFLRQYNKDREWSILGRKTTCLNHMKPINVVSVVYFYKAYISKAI